MLTRLVMNRMRKKDMILDAVNASDEWLSPWEVSDLAGCPGGCIGSWSTSILKKLADKGLIDRKGYDPTNYIRQNKVKYRGLK